MVFISGFSLDKDVSHRHASIQGAGHHTQYAIHAAGTMGFCPQPSRGCINVQIRFWSSRCRLQSV